MNNQNRVLLHPSNHQGHNALNPKINSQPSRSDPNASLVTGHIYNYLLSLLESLSDVEQSPQYHPEGNALFHSLQVFQHALSGTDDPELWAAALFHDVGKAAEYRNHEKTGAALLNGLLPSRSIWLVRHHMDLLSSAQKTRKRFRGSAKLHELEQLRKWDLAGREFDAEVMSPEEALTILFESMPI